MYKPVIDPEVDAAVWRQYLPQILGQRASNLYVRCTLKPKTWFVEEFIRPALYRPEQNTYVHVADNQFEVGRNHEMAQVMKQLPEVEGYDTLGTMSFFTNELRLPSDVADTEERPSERIVLGDYAVLTYEFDVAEAAFLRHQIGWLLTPKNPLDGPIGAFYRVCSEYADFVGICVACSGGKSLHINVVFSTALARAAFGLSNRTSQELRHGYATLWERLHLKLVNTLDTQGRFADRSLRFPEQLRRMPGGRRIAGDGHILGIAKGTNLLQVVLWEQKRNRASGNELPIFLTPDAFVVPLPRFSSSRCARASRVGPMTEEQERYCSDRLRELFPAWPRFAYLSFESDTTSLASATPSRIGCRRRSCERTTSRSNWLFETPRP